MTTFNELMAEAMRAATDLETTESALRTAAAAYWNAVETMTDRLWKVVPEIMPEDHILFRLADQGTFWLESNDPDEMLQLAFDSQRVRRALAEEAGVIFIDEPHYVVEGE